MRWDADCLGLHHWHLWLPVGVGQWKSPAGGWRVRGRWDCDICCPRSLSAGPSWNSDCSSTRRRNYNLWTFYIYHSLFHFHQQFLPHAPLAQGHEAFIHCYSPATYPSLLVFLYLAHVPINSPLNSPQTIASEFAICFLLGPWLYTTKPQIGSLYFSLHHSYTAHTIEILFYFLHFPTGKRTLFYMLTLSPSSTKCWPSCHPNCWPFERVMLCVSGLNRNQILMPLMLCFPHRLAFFAADIFTLWLLLSVNTINLSLRFSFLLRTFSKVL